MLQTNLSGAICSGNSYDIFTMPLKIFNSKFIKNIAGKKYNIIYTYKNSKLTKKNVTISLKRGLLLKNKLREILSPIIFLKDH